MLLRMKRGRFGRKAENEGSRLDYRKATEKKKRLLITETGAVIIPSPKSDNYTRPETG